MRAFAILGITNAVVVTAAFLVSVVLQSIVFPAVSLSVLLSALAIMTGGITTFGLGLAAEALVRVGADKAPVYIVRSQVGRESESPILRLADRNLLPEQRRGRARPTGT